jgi:hypothetical protein
MKRFGKIPIRKVSRKADVYIPDDEISIYPIMIVTAIWVYNLIGIKWGL